MTFEWSKTGIAPAPDEFEITVVGPGFGECIIIHVGAGRWIIVDSCVDRSVPGNPIPVAERYLRHLGVPLDTHVDLVVATHWHDDHVRGISRLVDSCAAARFSCANALTKSDFIQYIKALETGSSATDGAKVKEFNQVLRILRARNGVVRTASGSKTLASWTAADLGRMTPCEVRSLSPSDREFQMFLDLMVEMTPQSHQPKKSAPRQDPNLGSVVLHIDAGEFSVLLGADMEIHHDTDRGWNSVLAEANVSQTAKAEVFKVPHHGSVNGHHDQVWAGMLHAKPICIVTPFNRLPETKKLPTEADMRRLSAYGRVFLTAGRLTKRATQRDPAVLRSLKESQIITRDLSGPVGMVRLRRRYNGGSWRTEVFSPAQEL